MRVPRGCYISSDVSSDPGFVGTLHPPPVGTDCRVGVNVFYLMTRIWFHARSQRRCACKNNILRVFCSTLLGHLLNNVIKPVKQALNCPDKQFSADKLYWFSETDIPSMHWLSTFSSGSFVQFPSVRFTSVPSSHVQIPFIVPERWGKNHLTNQKLLKWYENRIVALFQMNLQIAQSSGSNTGVPATPRGYEMEFHGVTCILE